MSKTANQIAARALDKAAMVAIATARHCCQCVAIAARALEIPHIFNKINVRESFLIL